MSTIDRKFESNIYYHPEKCGFWLITTCDEPNLDYKYSTYILLQDKETNVFYGAGDSGCSCPKSFEDYLKMSELTRIPTLEEFESELRAHFAYQLKTNHMLDFIKTAIGTAAEAGLE